MSIFVTLFIILFTILITILGFVKSKTNKVVNGPITEETTPANPNYLDKLKMTFMFGIRNHKLSRFYNSIFMIRRILVAFVLVTFTGKEAQLVFYIFVNILYTIYICVSRPFEHLVHNIVAIINECMLLL